MCIDPVPETVGLASTKTHPAQTRRRQLSTGWTAARPRSAGGKLTNHQTATISVSE